MSDNDKRLSRLQALFTSLLKYRLSESLEQVDEALRRWRSEELGPFEAHAELLKHVARSERLAATIVRAEGDDTAPVLKDAYDVGLLDAAEFEELVGKKPDDVECAPALAELAELDELDELGQLDDVELRQLPPKREYVENLMDEGPVLVHVDSSSNGVSVPDHLRGDPRLVLRFGWGLAPAIVDLDVDAEGITGTLTFGGVPHHCVLPWSAIYAVVSEASQHAMVWPDDVPPAVLDQMSQESTPGTDIADAADSPSPDAPSPALKPGLRGMPSPAGGGGGKSNRAAGSSKPRPNHLKLVE